MFLVFCLLTYLKQIYMTLQFLTVVVILLKAISTFLVNGLCVYEGSLKIVKRQCELVTIFTTFYWF